jgi:hypothetical protein
MEKAYKDLDIQFLPDALIQELKKNNLLQTDIFLINLNSINEHFHNLF